MRTILVKVYHLNLTKHYLENNTEIDPTQNLSYLYPNHSYHYEISNDSPCIVSHHEIKIEGIAKKRGVWIVELEGEGISSRAFLRKGAIGSSSVHTSVGH